MKKKYEREFAMVSIMILISGWAFIFVLFVGILVLIDFSRNVRNESFSEAREDVSEFNQKFANTAAVPPFENWSDPHARFRPKF